MLDFFRLNRLFGQYDPAEEVLSGRTTYTGQPIRPPMDIPQVDIPQDMMNRRELLFPPTHPNRMVPENPVPIPEPMGPMAESATFDMNRFRDLYQPETRFQDMMLEAINNMPQKPQPSKTKRVLAGIGGGLTADPKAAHNILYGPYERQMQDWKMRFDPLNVAAGQERATNQGNRQFAEAVLRDEQTNRRISETERHNKEQEETARKRAEIAEKRAQAYVFKQNNPNFQFKIREDGQIVAINPQDPTQIVDTGIKSGELNDYDKIQLGLDASLARIAASGAEARKTEEVRQGNRVDMEHLRQTGRIKLLDERQARGLGSSTTESQDQLKKRWMNNAQRLIAENPEYERWIDVDSESGFPVIKDEIGSYWSGRTKIDPKFRQKLVDSIYESAQVVRQTTPPNTTPNTTATGNTAGGPPIKRIRIKNKATGQTGVMPENKPVPEGWEKVGYVD